MNPLIFAASVIVVGLSIELTFIGSGVGKGTAAASQLKGLQESWRQREIYEILYCLA